MHSSTEVEKVPQETLQGFGESTPAHVQVNVIAPARPNAATHFRRGVRICEIFADLVTITIAVIAGYGVYETFSLGKHVHYELQTVLTLGIAFSVVMILMLDRAGAYRSGNSLLRVRETEQVLRVSAEACLVVLAVSFFTNMLVSRWLLVLCLGLVPLLLFVQKSITYLLVRFLHSRGYGNEKVLIYGSGHTGRRVFSVLSRSPKLGLEPVAFVDDDPAKAGGTVYEMGYERRRSASIVPGPISREMIAGYGAEIVIIAIPSIGREMFLRTVDETLRANAKVSFVPSHLLSSDPWIDYQDVDGVLMASLGKPNRRIGYEFVKRTCDFLAALVLVTIGLPVFLLLGIAIKLDSAGPILFRQERIGQNGKSFKMFKFRTMRTDASPYDYSPRSPEDSRITRIGRFLRKTSLDELPQLLNVLQGNMSLVGPRPEMPFIVEQYKERHRQRLQVKPGVTGLWQLSGDRAFLIHENVEYDLYYIQHRNFFMDLAILLHTSIFAMRGV
ncbi:MAG TPA: sugar transferase [Terriglobales bacterium]|jgi:exopolysaccharide biosynthesis polyprenyl glycosylphosphotransferase|nr:sugar transferase [Terriglobales bacterium]